MTSEPIIYPHIIILIRLYNLIVSFLRRKFDKKRKYETFRIVVYVITNLCMCKKKKKKVREMKKIMKPKKNNTIKFIFLYYSR